MAIVFGAGFLIMMVKFLAWYITGSTAILTDALESIINVLAAGFALYSINFSRIPKDENHPYGHGKIEFLSAGFEGGLIILAGISMLVKGVWDFVNQETLESLSLGIYLTAGSSIANLVLSIFLKRSARELNSLALSADADHLITDVYSSVALIAGLIVISFTGWYWLDPLVALVFASFILFTGYKLIRTSLAGLLDEADYELIEELVDVLNRERRDKWIDIHNLRVQKYGERIHVDCHVTMPWYYNLEETHREVDAIDELVNHHMGAKVEFFIHVDPCKPSSCPICKIEDCRVRQHPFEKQINWKMKNILPNKRHGV